MIELDFITARLKGFYPNTTVLTPAILSEMADRLRRQGWSNETFNKALAAYRSDRTRVDRRETRTPPTVQQLIYYSNQGRRRGPVADSGHKSIPRKLAFIGIKEAYWRVCKDREVRQKLEAEIIALRQECRERGIPLRTWLGDLPDEQKPDYLKSEQGEPHANRPGKYQVEDCGPVTGAETGPADNTG